MIGNSNKTAGKHLIIGKKIWLILHIFIALQSTMSNAFTFD